MDFVPDMTPERTGRKNRSIGSRTDLYSLDVFDGNLPCTTSDPVEWVHCHTARHPMAPHDRAKSSPARVFAIVMKPDAKTPEEGDQNAFSVESDLRRRVGEWEPHKFI